MIVCVVEGFAQQRLRAYCSAAVSGCECPVVWRPRPATRARSAEAAGNAVCTIGGLSGLTAKLRSSCAGVISVRACSKMSRSRFVVA